MMILADFNLTTTVGSAVYHRRPAIELSSTKILTYVLFLFVFLTLVAVDLRIRSGDLPITCYKIYVTWYRLFRLGIACLNVASPLSPVPSAIG